MFDTRYMITANFRADASSRFAENNKWGYFPSVSVGWRISNEGFMQKFDWLSDLKLRASTGKLGNQEIERRGPADLRGNPDTASDGKPLAKAFSHGFQGLPVRPRPEMT